MRMGADDVRSFPRFGDTSHSTHRHDYHPNRPVIIHSGSTRRHPSSGKETGQGRVRGGDVVPRRARRGGHQGQGAEGIEFGMEVNIPERSEWMYLYNILRAVQL
jgi:hypothetical protein